MADALLYLWDLSVGVGIFGFGLTATRLLRLQRAPLAVAGTLGISLWITAGAYLNILHVLRPAVFIVMTAIGVVLTLFELLTLRKRALPSTSSAQPHPPLSLLAKLLLGAAIAVIGTLAIGAARPLAWSVDDIQGYAAMAVKAAQTHALQPDPFCERRVQAGVGGGNFLDTMMFATGDLRAMHFIDSSFGLILYALGLWAIGRRWKVPPAGIAFALLCLPFASLLKVNLTIVYLSAAAFFAALLLLSDTPPTADSQPATLSPGHILALGIIVGASCTTKSPNIVFFVPFLFAAALLYKLLEPRARTVAPTILALLVAVAVFLPWSIPNKTIAGTYLYPLLGLGIHASAYHFIPTPSQLGTWPLVFAVTVADIVLLALGTLVAWKLTRSWHPAARSAAIAYLAVSLLAIPITVHGLGGQSADRYTAPFLIPALLLSLLIVLGAPGSAPGLWRRIGIATQVAAALYIFLYVESSGREFRNLKAVAYQAVGVSTEQPSYMTSLSAAQLRQSFDYAARVQASIPAGAVALSVTQLEFPFDFRRNTIDIADWPGMASPPPGLPLRSDAATQLQFLRSAGVQYIIDDLSGSCATTHWDTFFELPKMHYPWTYFFLHEPSAHNYIAWGILEAQVSCHEIDIMRQIVDHSPIVFNDGHTRVAKID
jgi:hypothetical protein